MVEKILRMLRAAPRRRGDRTYASAAPRSGSQCPTTRDSVLKRLRTKNKPKGDQAWQVFFGIYAPIVYRFARHARLSHEDSLDVQANVMRNLLQWFRHGGEKKATRGRFRDFLRTVINNEIVAQWRRLRPHAELDAALTKETREPGEDPLIVIEREERLRQCLETTRLRVAPRDWEIFDSYFLKERPPAQVARRFGISVSRVYVIKHEVGQVFGTVWDELNQILGEV